MARPYKIKMMGHCPFDTDDKCEFNEEQYPLEYEYDDVMYGQKVKVKRYKAQKIPKTQTVYVKGGPGYRS